MKKIFLAVVAVGLFSSCATMVNGNFQKVNVYSDEPGGKMVLNGVTYELPKRVYVPRSRYNLRMDYVTSEGVFEQEVPNRMSPYFYAGNLSFFTAAPVGYLVDLVTESKYEYPNKIVLSKQPYVEKSQFKVHQKELLEKHKAFIADTLLFADGGEKAFYYKYIGKKAGENLVYFRFPSLQIYNLNSNGYRIHTGGWISAGIGNEYYLSDKNFISTEVGVNFRGVWEPSVYNRDVVVLFYTDNRITQYYVSSMYHKRFHDRWDFGLGLQFTYNRLDFIQRSGEFVNSVLVSDSFKRINDSNVMLGLSSSISYNLGRGYFIGWKYAPHFLSFADYGTRFVYQSVSMLDFKYKF